MDKNELLKDLKKIDLALVEKSDIKMFEAEKMAVEYYNDAVDNILEGNTDIAIIKLKKVLSLSPDFSEASSLHDKINEYEKSHSIGDKVYESMHGRDVHDRKIPGKKTLPQKLHINPRLLLKIILACIAVTAVTVAVMLMIRLLGNNDKPDDNTEKVITYSQEEVQVLNDRIDELEELLAQSERETQDALSSAEGNDEAIISLQEQNKSLAAKLELYRAEVLFRDEKYTQSADIAMSLNADDYKGEEKELYNNVYNKAIYQAANSLYETGLQMISQKNYAKAVEYLSQVDDYSPDFEELGNCYFKLGQANYEIDKPEESIRLYEYIENNIPEYQNPTGIIYYTAKAYQKLGNYTKATELYNQLISEYPKSELVGYAKDRLREME